MAIFHTCLTDGKIHLLTSFYYRAPWPIKCLNLWDWKWLDSRQLYPCYCLVSNAHTFTLKWLIPFGNWSVNSRYHIWPQSIFKMGHSRSLFSSFRYSWQQTNKCPIWKFADGWIRTPDLLRRKRPLYQLSHNHCPSLTSVNLSFEPNLEMVYFVAVQSIIHRDRRSLSFYPTALDVLGLNQFGNMSICFIHNLYGLTASLSIISMVCQLVYVNRRDGSAYLYQPLTKYLI